MHKISIADDLARYRFVPMATLAAKTRQTLEKTRLGETLVIMQDNVPQAILVNPEDYINLLRQVSQIHTPKSQPEPKPKLSKKKS